MRNYAPLTEEHPELLHYTDSQGLEGILNSQSLWATNYLFLNDLEEIIHFGPKLVEFITPIIQRQLEGLAFTPAIAALIEERKGIENLAGTSASRMVKHLYANFGDEIYITSFCGTHPDPLINANGLLSQWRAYGKDGGYAIVFDTKKLMVILNKESSSFLYSGSHIGTLVYSNDTILFSKEFSPDIRQLTDWIDKQLKHNLLRQKKPNGQKSYHSFLSCISRYKHWGFREENEVRIAVVPTSHEDYLFMKNKKMFDNLPSPKPIKPRKFINRNGTMVRYVELFAKGSPNSLSPLLPIKKIIVGPHKDKELRKDALTSFLKEKSMADVEVVTSQIPFV